jgi:uncharacterized protein YjiS (DUF1127 family)
MNEKIPVLPIAASALMRAFLAMVAFLAHWRKALARARHHRREAAALAGLDRHVLADIGVTSADLRDAFSQPFWEDPTELLRERAGECRASHDMAHRLPTRSVETAFRRPPIDRLPRYLI